MLKSSMSLGLHRCRWGFIAGIDFYRQFVYDEEVIEETA